MAKISPERRFEFKVRMFPLVMQTLHNCRRLLKSDLDGTWYKFRDGDYGGAYYDCDALITFAQRLGFMAKKDIEVERENDVEHRFHRIIDGDSKSIFKAFRDEIDEVEETEREERRECAHLREIVAEKQAEIARLHALYGTSSGKATYELIENMSKRLAALMSDIRLNAEAETDPVRKAKMEEWGRAVLKEMSKCDRKILAMDKKLGKGGGS